MKRINRYFSAGCISYTILALILSITHMIDKKSTIYVSSFLHMFVMIMVIQTVLYFMENIPVKSQYIHMAYEFIVIVVLTFAIGIPTGVIEEITSQSIIELIVFIAAAYGVVMASLYIDSTRDADEINKQLLERKR